MNFKLKINYCTWGEPIKEEQCKEYLLSRYYLIKDTNKEIEINISTIYIFKILEELIKEQLVEKKHFAIYNNGQFVIFKLFNKTSLFYFVNKKYQLSLLQ